MVGLCIYTSTILLCSIAFLGSFSLSEHQIVDKKNSTGFSLKASRAEIRFHSNPGLSKPSFLNDPAQDVITL